MTRFSSLALVVAALASVAVDPAGARAQRTLAYDTLSDSTPVAVTCGFCAGEAFGVVFRELPTPLRGLDPGDFPIELRSVSIAMASARTTGSAGAYACEGVLAGGTVLATVEVWAGMTPPSGSIADRPIADAWTPGEILAWASDEVPIELSVPDADGSSRFALTLNTIELADESGGPVVIPMPATYVRVVVTLPGGGESTACDALSLEGPGGVPVRDDDGRISDERSFIYAEGAGFLWNEEARAPGASDGIAGDWAIRLSLVPSTTTPPRDGGPRPSDAGAGGDAGELDGGGALDAGAGEDAGGGGGGGDGCACAAAGSRTGRAGDRAAWAATLAGAIAASVAARARRRRRA